MVVFHRAVWPGPATTVPVLFVTPITSWTTSPVALATLMLGCVDATPVAVATTPSGADWLTPVHDVAPHTVLVDPVPVRSRAMIPVPLAGAVSLHISTRTAGALVSIDSPTLVSETGAAPPAPSASHVSVLTARVDDETFSIEKETSSRRF
jgi:hypothetical protein